MNSLSCMLNVSVSNVEQCKNSQSFQKHILILLVTSGSIFTCSFEASKKVHQYKWDISYAHQQIQYSIVLQEEQIKQNFFTVIVNNGIILNIN